VPLRVEPPDPSAVAAVLKERLDADAYADTDSGGGGDNVRTPTRSFSDANLSASVSVAPSPVAAVKSAVMTPATRDSRSSSNASSASVVSKRRAAGGVDLSGSTSRGDHDDESHDGWGPVPKPIGSRSTSVKRATVAGIVGTPLRMSSVDAPVGSAEASSVANSNTTTTTPVTPTRPQQHKTSAPGATGLQLSNAAVVTAVASDIKPVEDSREGTSLVDRCLWHIVSLTVCIWHL